MSQHNSTFRTQTRGLLLRTWHYERRQTCSIFCNIILPPILLIFLSVLARTLKAREVDTFPFQQRPEGAFVPRPFNPLKCATDFNPADGLENILQQCEDDALSQKYTVPVFAPQELASLVGERDATDIDANSGLLAGLSLEPFIYPPALDDGNPSTQTFFDTQTSYDGIFLYAYFLGDKSNPIYRSFTQTAQRGAIDDLFQTSTESFDTEQEFKDNFFKSWFGGSVNPLYSTGLSFQELSQNSQGDLRATATVFFNESITPNCTLACPLVSNVIKAHNAFYSTLMQDKTATAYLRRMPLIDASEDLGVIRLVISIVIGFTTHFWLPSFLRFLIFERESGIRAMMSMMGLGRFRYWFATYTGFYLQYTISVVLSIIMGLAAGILFYKLNTPVSYLVLFFLWGHTLVAFAMAIAPFFRNPETAQILGWLYILVISFIGGPFLGRRLSDENTSESTWSAIMLLPSFAYLRSVYYAGALNSGGKGVVIGSEQFNSAELGMCARNGPFCKSYAFLVVQWAVLLTLAFYFDLVFPTAVGNRLHPLFFLGFKRKTKYIAEESKKTSNEADVANEEDRATAVMENIQNEPFDGVVLNKLSKTYAAKTPVKALRGLSLVARKNEVLTILGHNGAGKTTAFKTLVGELEATSGTALICGKSILTEMSDVYRLMGVAPQHDILWKVLSVEEHLYFYGRLKNLSGRALKDAVESSLESVQLTSARKRQARRLSGGMRRRLSVSVALIGGPQFIMLDEPSTGLDILAREKLWNSIEKAKEGKVIILTTHSLEEAETLSDRVAIISNGQLKCIGKVEELKMRLGRGYHLTVSLPASKVGALHEVIMKAVPGAEIETQVGGSVEYVLPKSFAVTEIFELMGREKEELVIRDWAVNQSTLEDVFMEVVERSRREEEKRLDAMEP